LDVLSFCDAVTLQALQVVYPREMKSILAKVQQLNYWLAPIRGRTLQMRNNKLCVAVKVFKSSQRVWKWKYIALPEKCGQSYVLDADANVSVSDKRMEVRSTRSGFLDSALRMTYVKSRLEKSVGRIIFNTVTVHSTCDDMLPIPPFVWQSRVMELLKRCFHCSDGEYSTFFDSMSMYKAGSSRYSCVLKAMKDADPENIAAQSKTFAKNIVKFLFGEEIPQKFIQGNKKNISMFINHFSHGIAFFTIYELHALEIKLQQRLGNPIAHVEFLDPIPLVHENVLFENVIGNVNCSMKLIENDDKYTKTYIISFS